MSGPAYDQACGEDLLSMTKCPCKAGELLQDKQQGRQSRGGEHGSNARGSNERVH